MAKHQQTTDEKDAVRLDKWLWAARFYKTRTLAKEMIDGGKVHYNGQRSKPNKIVEVGATLKLRQGSEEREITVLALSTQRRGAAEAQLLYRETEQSVANREKLAMARKMNALTMPHPDRRPDKKERRDLLKFKHRNQE
ncbi:heat-shock protein [Aggregatibacter actinomycetemcomitans]|uniref:Heat shock protein 15 n=1 Tax=Aggregatibacter actinomycetemcomitans TaxID=714 RepID=A0A142FZD4_AGGAC|nr:ribosome-associated heat shock protein Hsp15 [Aggregatibacter actinomycetemcomitans]AFI86608.1 ribosome-associated heat shock protein Hsp15 [Aggregatibacter actinomycetemcomitans D7S-1]KYK92812.1 ribosome-associated heat shock protein Hsp15 [Aggregatibacter actinomycetemcomitans serotype d str. SA3733]AMQ93764.1 heat-shock protein [Aggregatibacter actinomycetemcomitans]ANU81881.1 heat-shock protein [Aggregatibacter actinomycetemcomitans]EKX93768.1 heat shock protein 15 [Aggregatibacter acti